MGRRGGRNNRIFHYRAPKKTFRRPLIRVCHAVKLVAGRGDFIPRLSNSAQPIISGSKSSANIGAEFRVKRLRELIDFRARMAQLGATQILRCPQQRVLRADATLTFNCNDSVQAWGSIGRRWTNGFRVIFDTGRDLVSGR